MSLISGPVRETVASARLVAANPNLRRVNLALAGSMIGDWAYNTAIVVWLYENGGPAYVGGYAVVRLLLIALGVPFLSALVDRLSKKAFLITTDLVRAGLVLIAAALIWLDGPRLVVVTLAVLVGFIGGPFRPAQAALLPQLAHSPQELTAANAMSSTLESLAFFLGPALAGLLLTVTGVPVLFVINAASFVWSALMIGRLVVPSEEPHAEETPAGDEQNRLLAEVTAGFRVIGADRSLLLLTGLACAQTVVAGALVVFVVTIAFDVVRLGGPGVGYLHAVLGIGAICGGLVALGRAARGSVAQDFGAGVIGWSAPLLLVAIWPSPITAFLAFLLIGFGNPLVDVNFATLVQRVAPAAVLGRVFGALESALFGAMGLGALLFPLFLELVGLSWALVIIGAPVGVAAAASLPRLRRLDRSLAPPPHLDLVQALPLFQPLRPALQEDLARKLIPVKVTAGHMVIVEGEMGDRFYLIEFGRLDAVRGDILLTEMGRGRLLRRDRAAARRAAYRDCRRPGELDAPGAGTQRLPRRSRRRPRGIQPG